MNLTRLNLSHCNLLNATYSIQFTPMLRKLPNQAQLNQAQLNQAKLNQAKLNKTKLNPSQLNPTNPNPTTSTTCPQS